MNAGKSVDSTERAFLPSTGSPRAGEVLISSEPSLTYTFKCGCQCAMAFLNSASFLRKPLHGDAGGISDLDPNASSAR
jgi:hypothetical protein